MKSNTCKEREIMVQITMYLQNAMEESQKQYLR